MQARIAPKKRFSTKRHNPNEVNFSSEKILCSPMSLSPMSAQEVVCLKSWMTLPCAGLAASNVRTTFKNGKNKI